MAEGMPTTPLYTNDGKFVCDVPTLPWAKEPELLFWGERFFILREDGRYTEAAGSFFVVPWAPPTDA